MKTLVPILDLKPTQFAVGMLEIDQKIDELKDAKKKFLRRYVRDCPVPVVISPHGKFYVVDHHHFLCVCYQLGVEEVHIKVIEDLSKRKMSFAAFWKWMHKRKNVYPYCQFGEGPRKALYLPHDIRGLADDPYRSLAWFVRKAGAFDNSDKNFAEFKWANFFRARGLLDKHGIDGIPKALVKASKLAQSKAAKGLPGYGVLKLAAQKSMTEKAKKSAQKALKKIK